MPPIIGALREWFEKNPEFRKPVESFKLFSTRPIVRRKLPVEIPTFCCDCGKPLPPFSFKLKLPPYKPGNPVAMLCADMTGDEDGMIELVPINRLCNACDDAYDKRLEEMRKLSLPPVKPKHKLKKRRKDLE